MNLISIAFDNRSHCEAIAGLWTGACGPALALSPRFVSYSTQPLNNVIQAGRFAWIDGEPVGFVIASAVTNSDPLGVPNTGWINAIATLPETQRQGIATALLAWAEWWLAEQGCHRVQLGGSLRPFVPALPLELNAEQFFSHRGYQVGRHVWDVSANLAKYSPPKAVREVAGAIRPAQLGQEQEILAFLRREFPGRWRYEFEQFLVEKGRLSDFMLLWTEEGLDGFCRLTFEDSQRSVERFFPYQLPRPWSQLGPIGVSQAQRGKGFGAALLDGGLRRLHNNGINGCVIDWTTLVDFYGLFGFEEYRAYQQMEKVLGESQN